MARRARHRRGGSWASRRPSATAPTPTRAGWYAAAGNTYPTLPGAEVKPSDALRHPVRFAEFVWQGFLPPAPGMADLRPAGARFPNFHGYIERGWAAFGFVAIPFPKWVYAVIVLAMLGLGVLGVVAWALNRAAVARRGWELGVLVLVVLGVFFGTEVASFTPGAGPSCRSSAATCSRLPPRSRRSAAVATFGAGRRRAPAVAAGLVTALLVLFWASEFLTMSALYSSRAGPRRISPVERSVAVEVRPERVVSLTLRHAAIGDPLVAVVDVFGHLIPALRASGLAALFRNSRRWAWER